MCVNPCAKASRKPTTVVSSKLYLRGTVLLNLLISSPNDAHVVRVVCGTCWPVCNLNGSGPRPYDKTMRSSASSD